ncbi:amino acid dehydrogenase [Luminiphilus sp.]|nr:amino acid dehydrogenase [Luminiphilus sp.]
MNTFTHPEFSNHERVVFVTDAASGLKAIIAVHSSQLGPAIGGCRMWPYASALDALTDVLRLSRGMTYKNALAGIASGGGKSVIIGDPTRDKSASLMRAMGKAIHDLGGLYTAAEDSGTSPSDMALMTESTHYVAGLDHEWGSGDPSPSTALGVFLSLKKAVLQRFGQPTVNGLRVNVQGLGQVGFALAGLLVREGAEVCASDTNENTLLRAVDELSVTPLNHEEIFTNPCDIFAPCAMGGILNETTIPRLSTQIVAGAANNQLQNETDHLLLHERGILYCPDYLINAGGVIDVYHRRQGHNIDAVQCGVADIAERTQSILTDAHARQISPETVAAQHAETLLSQPAREKTRSAAA